MEQIERIIQFAIDNCDKFWDFDYERYEKIKVYKNYIHLLDDSNCKYFSDNLIELITSKPFIEAVARGKIKESSFEIHNEKWRDTKFYIILNKLIREDKVVDFLRNEISKAIFNEKIWEFIDNLLPNIK